jgi:hypothetical protein
MGTITRSKAAPVSFSNIVDTGTEGTKVATGTTAQRGTTAGQFRYNSTTGKFEGKNASTFVPIQTLPTVTSIDDTEVDSAGGGNQTIVITGTNFESGAVASFVGSTATFYAATTTVDSSTQITAVAPKASFLNAQEPYGVKVLNTSGLSGTLDSQINVDNAPTWTTASGSLGNIYDNDTGTHTTLVAADAEGDTVAYTETGATNISGAGLALDSSTGIISGDPTDVGADTTVSFDVRATAGAKTADRSFSVIIKPGATGGDLISSYSYGGNTYRIHKFTSSGNFIVSTTTTVDYLIIGGGGGGGFYSGGGGGAGGLVWETGVSLSAATYGVVIGTGGASGNPGSSVGYDYGDAGVASTFNSKTAMGGGGGAYHSGYGSAGGCGGGTARTHAVNASTQYSTYSYGVGYAGGFEGLNEYAPLLPGYPGGGTGAIPASGSLVGGIGNSTFLTDAATTTAFLLGAVAGTDSSNVATTSSSTGTLYIGGGGGGSSQDATTEEGPFLGGAGGGGSGNSSGSTATIGIANTGSGSGGQGYSSTTNINGTLWGGSGIVIVRYI